jgi:hypothetical protein
MTVIVIPGYQYRKDGEMIELRTPGELDAMRAAGAVVARMLAAVRAAAAPGVRLTQLGRRRGGHLPRRHAPAGRPAAGGHRRAGAAGPRILTAPV